MTLNQGIQMFILFICHFILLEYFNEESLQGVIVSYVGLHIDR